MQPKVEYASKITAGRILDIAERAPWLPKYKDIKCWKQQGASQLEAETHRNKNQHSLRNHEQQDSDSLA